MAIGIISRPEARIIDGKATSTEVTPATEIGASLPKKRRNSGAPISANSSRNILASSAIVPSSVASCTPSEGVFNCTISIEERE